jgi:23S rRNA (uridine2552-2'-O)-methyltransferase
MATYEPKDRFFHRAKAAGYRARSAYKLAEILELAPRQNVRGQHVLDLGAAPGGWLQVLSEAVGNEGSVVGLDLVPIAPLGGKSQNVRTHVVDVRDRAAMAVLPLPRRFVLVSSDMAPKTSGIHDLDATRSLELLSVALNVARERLDPGGSFVAKVFMGGDLEGFLTAEVRPSFAQVRQVRPEATRSGSREIYVVGKGFRPVPR